MAEGAAPLIEDVLAALLGRYEKMTASSPAPTDPPDPDYRQRRLRCSRCRQFDLGLLSFTFPGDFADAFADPARADRAIAELRSRIGRHRVDLCHACIAELDKGDSGLIHHP